MSVLPVNLRFEHQPTSIGPTALGMGTAVPRISWELVGDGVFDQSAYEIELARPGRVETAVVKSSEQVLVPWPFAPLGSRERAGLRVRVGSGDDWTDWSEQRAVEVALLSPGDWTAEFVTPKEVGGMGSPAPWVRGAFAVQGPVAMARLYTTALGVYEAWLNGRRVGDEILAPGWTSYKNRLCYQTYDVTGLLVQGDNTLEALLGNGWYRGQLTWLKRRAVYGDRLAYLAQLEITYTDGSSQSVVTDGSWKAAESGVLQDDLYDGQLTDLRVANSGRWTPVEIIERDFSTVVASQGPPVRRLMTIPAREVTRTQSGKYLVDFGQNLVGWVRVEGARRRSGPRGDPAPRRSAGERGARYPTASQRRGDRQLYPQGDKRRGPRTGLHVPRLSLRSG